jgi:hypothetical protein
VPDGLNRPAADGSGSPTPERSGGELFAVQYEGESFPFWNGTRMLFGRDDSACQIPIWEEINRRTLSKIAGELWCTNDQMWARNLSTAHELVVAGSRGVHELPPRLPPDPGDACSVPVPSGTVTAPSTGRWSLRITPVDPAHSSGPTIQIENIPDRHREAAEALCAPMLAGGRAVATYGEIAARMGWSERAARRRVDDLCAHYEAQIGALPGGRLERETLAQSVARILVSRNKFAVPPLSRVADPEPSRGRG